MNSQEIYQDVYSILNGITQRLGTDAIKIGLVSALPNLPRKISKLFVWYFNSANEASLVLGQLLNDFRIEAVSSTGQYLYVYETENQNHYV